MIETWKVIIEYPIYSISSLGRVKNTTNDKILSSKTNKHPYASVLLGRAVKGKNTRRYVHRLVATYFIDNSNQFKIVNHKNSNKKDNRVENLEWCTAQENTAHSWKTGTSIPIPHKLNQSWVNLIRALYKNKEFSQFDLAYLFGIAQQTVSDIVSGNIWKEVT